MGQLKGSGTGVFPTGVSGATAVAERPTRPTTNGVLCGRCRKNGVEHPYHATSADVRACYSNGTAVQGRLEVGTGRKQVKAPGAIFVGEGGLPTGTYTVVFDDGDYRTFKVTADEADEEFWNERTVIRLLTGPDNESSYTGVAHVTDDGRVVVWKKARDAERLNEALRVLVGDPKAAASAYGLRSGKCGLCGRTLTTPESLERGIGPVCAEKLA
jgi:hypothetical protein